MRASDAVREVVWPATFTAAMAYLAWYLPKFFILTGIAAEAMTLRFSPAGIVDFAVAALALAALVMGVATIRPAPQEGQATGIFDRLSLFLGRVTMLLIVTLVCVMTYEVVLRYVFERPTLWANELSLWMAGLIFLLAGLYAMQQRSHIRIYLLYDLLPRGVQRACDSVSTLLIMVFAAMMIWGGFTEAYDKLLRWETFGTAFDPPIPATLKPLILLVIVLVAVQALINLVSDWHKGPEHHAVIDEAEVEDMVQELGERLKSGRG
jgi:TRAP-type C4-dicarboxylate transport system permease small subunit